MNELNISVAYLPEWVKLLGAKLTPETPFAPKSVEDDDPTPYRWDCRTWFVPVPDNHNRTHMAVLSLESDEERYRLYFSLDELPDENLATPMTVWRCPLDALKEQTFSFSSSDILEVSSPINRDVTINVHISEAKVVPSLAPEKRKQKGQKHV